MGASGAGGLLLGKNDILGRSQESRSDRMLDLIVVGDVMMDVILKSDRQMYNALEFEGTNYFRSSLVVPGGSGNVAAALSHLGGRAGMIGRAGSDAHGKAYIQDLESLNVSAEIESDKSLSTGLAVSLVEPEGHRTMLVSRGANDHLTQDDVKEHLSRLGPAKFIYLSGYSLLNLPQREAILEAGRIGRGNGSKVVLDPGSPNLVKDLPDVFHRAIEACDVLCANLAESKVLANRLDTFEYARLLSRQGKSVIIKTGAEGCLVSVEGQLSNVQGVHANSVDTTGAGDAFLGSLLYCLSLDMHLIQSALFANWFAARTTESLGPRGFPSKEVAKDKLRSIRRDRVLEKQL